MTIIIRQRLLKNILIVFTICMTNIGFSQYNSYKLLLESYNQATFVETYRTFPEQISIQTNVIQPSQYFELLIKIITDIDAEITRQDYNATWQMPDTLYPAVILNNTIYEKMISKGEYIQLFNNLLTNYSDNAKLPESLSFRNHGFRFIDAYYLALVISRFYYSYGFLPSVVDPKVASPKGLFPWDVPDNKLMYLSGIQNEESDQYARYSEYYHNSAMDFEYYKLGKEIIGNETDQFNAGSLIYEYANSKYYLTPYGVYYDYENNFGFIYNSHEKLRNMQGTSGTPQLPKYGLYPAVAIPYGYDEYGYGAAVFINGQGWVNTEAHSPYGSDFLQNSFIRFNTTNIPFPKNKDAANINPGNNVVNGVNKILKLSSDASVTRAFWVNPNDILTYGADSLIQTAKNGEFNTIVVTVKTFMGNIYFNFNDPVQGLDRVKEDVLITLPLLAKANGIKLLVAIHNLSDYMSNLVCDCGLQFLVNWAKGYSTQFFITPCNETHKTFTKEVIKQLYENYDFDGIVFMRNYTFYDGWGNAECSSIPLQDKAAKETFLAHYVNDLGTYAKSLDNTRQTYYLTATEINNIGTSNTALVEEPDPNIINSSSIDGIFLSVNGTTWLFDENNTDFNTVYNKYISSNLPIYLTASLSKEWEYPPEFYRGLARYYKSLNSAGIIITANNSGEGELGPAFVKQHLGKLNNIRFTDSPPVQDVITEIEYDKNNATKMPDDYHLGQNYPNPFNPSTKINYSIPKTEFVTLKIYDLLGRELVQLVNEDKEPGLYKINFDGNTFPSGIYFYRLQAGNFRETKKFVLMK